MVRVTFVGAARTVTGSCYLVDTPSGRIMVDCGLFQGSGDSDEQNRAAFPFDPEGIDVLLLTHAHIDHSGMIPRLYKSGFKGPTLATHATVDLCSIMLADSGYIHESEAEWSNRKRRRAGRPLIEPLYTQRDAEKCMSSFRGVDYVRPYEVLKGVEVRFVDAGHILGSASIEMTVRKGQKKVRLGFSGDVGNTNQPIIRDPMPLQACDHVLIESTYGDRDHEDREDRAKTLAEIINETIGSGGNVVIPAFAVGRTQDVLYEVHRLQREGQIPEFPIFIDSPLAISATEIFARHPECFDREMREISAGGDSPFDFPGVTYTRSTEESVALNRVSGSMIISASGMANAGRIKHHLKHNLWRSESTILFVGFQAAGTLGRRLVDGTRSVTLFGEEVAVNARVETLPGFSAHADRHGLIRWLGRVRDLQRAFVVHGEESQCLAFSKLIEQRLDVHADVPALLGTVQLGPDGTAEWIEKGEELADERIQSVAELLDAVEARAREARKVLRDLAGREADSARLREVEVALRGALRALEDRSVV